MLPTDSHCDFMAKVNCIQNALLGVDVSISYEQAASVFRKLHDEYAMSFRLRRKNNVESGNTDKQQIKGKNFPHVVFKKLPGQCDVCGQLPSVCHQFGCGKSSPVY